MSKIKIYVSYKEKKSFDILYDGLSGMKISESIQFVGFGEPSHITLNIDSIKTVEDWNKMRGRFIDRLWKLHKKLNTKIQPNQKKVRV